MERDSIDATEEMTKEEYTGGNLGGELVYIKKFNKTFTKMKHLRVYQ